MRLLLLGKNEFHLMLHINSYKNNILPNFYRSPQGKNVKILFFEKNKNKIPFLFLELDCPRLFLSSDEWLCFVFLLNTRGIM